MVFTVLVFIHPCIVMDSLSRPSPSPCLYQQNSILHINEGRWLHAANSGQRPHPIMLYHVAHLPALLFLYILATLQSHEHNFFSSIRIDVQLRERLKVFPFLSPLSSVAYSYIIKTTLQRERLDLSYHTFYCERPASSPFCKYLCPEPQSHFFVSSSAR